jgi:hypothetical protein
VSQRPTHSIPIVPLLCAAVLACQGVDAINELPPDDGIGPAVAIAFTNAPVGIVAGAIIDPPVRVSVLDANGKVVRTNADVTLRLLAVDGSDVDQHLRGLRTFPMVSGVATFSGLSIPRMGSGYVLSAATSGLPVIASAPFDVFAGDADHFVISGPLSQVRAGQPFSVDIYVLDAYSNLSAAVNDTVELSLGENPSGGTLTATRLWEPSGAHFTMAGLRIDQPGAGYRLRAKMRHDAVPPGVSVVFTVIP